MAGVAVTDNIWVQKPELVDQLRDLWIEGLSCTQIARKLGNDITRNAVIGKVNRMGLNSPSQSPRPPRNPPKRQFVPPLTGGDQPSRNKNRMAPQHPDEGKKLLPVPDTERGPITILNIKDADCRYPYDDPAQPGGLLFCGRPQERGCFCIGHASFCYQKQGVADADAA